MPEELHVDQATQTLGEEKVQAPEKQFTQEWLNGIVAKERKSAQEKLQEENATLKASIQETKERSIVKLYLRNSEQMVDVLKDYKTNLDASVQVLQLCAENQKGLQKMWGSFEKKSTPCRSKSSHSKSDCGSATR